MKASGTTSAILIDRLGPPDVFVEREVPLPDPGPGEVHIRVEAAGVNFADVMMRVGLYGTVPPRPFSPGFEIAGTIERVGDGVEEWEPGDTVVALLRHGGYARDVVVPIDQVFDRPAAVNAVAAAATPVVFLTAWVALFEAARVRAEESVLILGAGGGVGTAAVQLAAAHGLRVIGTAGTPDKRGYVTGTLGAEVCFDSRGDWEPDVRRVVGHRGLDVALDPVGGEATAACRRLLAPLGRLVFYGLSQALPGDRRNWVHAAKAFMKTGRIHPAQLAEPNHGIFGIHLLHLGHKSHAVLMPAAAEIFRRVVAGELKPVIDTVFPLDRAGAVAAHERLHSRANLGKIVLAADA
ncbi:MAG: zinc-binding dehydrogenase [Gemmatimonadota bacterium]|nr:zinc-binding dehydrogenase [Gemmatimonadota bacterium]